MPFVHAVANRLIATFLIVMGVLMVVLAVGLWQQRESAGNFTDCTAKWQSDFLTAYEARSNASFEVQQAMDSIVLAVSNGDHTDFRRAVHHYLTVRDRQNLQRANHPLPPLPAVQCGQ